MDNKDFNEVEDIFGTDIEENYDVPVFNPESNSEDSSVNNDTVEVPVYEEVKPVEEVPVYDVQPEVNNSIDSVDAPVETEAQMPVFEESPAFEVQPEVTPVENYTTQSDVFDVQPEVTNVEPEPSYEAENTEVNYGAVPLEPNYDEDNSEVNFGTVPLEPNNEEENTEANYGTVPLEPNYDEEVNVHPDAVVSLNNDYEEEKDNTKLEDVPPINLKDNTSLKFVFIIGIIILIGILLLPLLNKFSI